MFSDEILSLVYIIKDIINTSRGDSDISEEDVDSYILNLLFETMFKKLHELSSDKIKDYYGIKIKKDKRRKIAENEEDEEKELQDVYKSVFNFNEKRNLVSVFADHLSTYLRHVPIHYTNECVIYLKNFMDNKKNNYRT